MAAESVVLALLAVLVVGLLRSHAEILRKLHELGAGLDDAAGAHSHGAGPVSVAPPSTRLAGDGAPAITGTTPFDEAVALSPGAGGGHDTLLAFLTTGCTTCQPFWESLAETPVTPTGARVVVVTRGPGDESVGAARKLAAGRVDVVMSSDAWQDYAVPGAPYFVQVDGRSGRVSGEGTAQTWGQVVQLLDRAATDAGLPGPWSSDAEREARIDEELEAAGILPGDPRLYGPPAE